VYTLLVIVGLLCGDSPDPPQELIPGRYIVEYGGSRYHADLYKDGTLLLKSNAGTLYQGFWNWDRKSRVVSVIDWPKTHPESVCIWTAELVEIGSPLGVKFTPDTSRHFELE
jgi:hypothetical protein